MKNPEFWVKETLSIVWKEKAISFQRAIQLSIGVTKDVHALSGMTVNLMEVRAMFQKVREQLSGQEFSNYPDVLKQSLIAIQSEFVVGLHLEAIDGIWRISANNVIEEMKSMPLLVNIENQIYEGEISIWKKPNDEIKAEIGHPATLEELQSIPGAELFIESKSQRWIF